MMLGEIQTVTDKTRDAAVELRARFFREEGFATPPSRIERLLADRSCWCALAVNDCAAQAIMTVSTVSSMSNGVASERLAISMSCGSTADAAWRDVSSSALSPCAGRKAARRSRSPSRRWASSYIGLVHSTRDSDSSRPVARACMRPFNNRA